MAVQVCPTLADLLSKNQCLENFAGLGTNIYIGLKDDLTAPMTQTDGEYTTPTFQSGKGLYKIQAKEDTVGIKGSSLGRRKGYSLELSFSLESVDQETAKVARALNNLDYFIILEDGDVSQIMYHAQHKITADSGGIASDTGQKSDDERQITFTLKLSPVTHPCEYVKAPSDGGWDKLLASSLE